MKQCASGGPPQRYNDSTASLTPSLAPCLPEAPNTTTQGNQKHDVHTACPWAPACSTNLVTPPSHQLQSPYHATPRILRPWGAKGYLATDHHTANAPNTTTLRPQLLPTDPTAPRRQPLPSSSSCVKPRIIVSAPPARPPLPYWTGRARADGGRPHPPASRCGPP